VGLETDSVVESGEVIDTGDLEGADADAVTGDADADISCRQLVVGEERAERIRQCLRVANLTVDDDAGLERSPRKLDELGPPVLLFDDGGRKLRRADLQPDDPATAPLIATTGR
jgi:hypothetical protein